MYRAFAVSREANYSTIDTANLSRNQRFGNLKIKLIAGQVFLDLQLLNDRQEDVK